MSRLTPMQIRPPSRASRGTRAALATLLAAVSAFLIAAVLLPLLIVDESTGPRPVPRPQPAPAPTQPR